MGTYRAPLEDMSFLIDELLDAETSLGALPSYQEHGISPDLTGALLDGREIAGTTPVRTVGCR